jgi:hypothetical protein
MTETQWLACPDPGPMLRFLLGTDQPRVMDVEAFPACKGSDRKLRLFACACYHRIRHLLPDEFARTTVGVAERFADGQADAAVLHRAWSGLQEALEAMEPGWRASRGAERTALLPRHEALALALQVCLPLAPLAAYYASSNACHSVAAITNPGAASYDAAFTAARLAEERAQACLLRCIFGDLPAQGPPAVAALLVWTSRDVVLLATGIYRDRDFSRERMGVLADAVEEAGVTDEQLRRHLCEPGAHCRGCFAVDLLLGKW